jgi:hypothetical protein
MEVGILRRDVHIHPALDDNRRTGFGAGVGSFEDLFPAPYAPTISEPGGVGTTLTQQILEIAVEMETEHRRIYHAGR